MRYLTATREMADSVYQVLQTAILTIYPKYYPKEAVDFFCRHHSERRVLDGIASGNTRVLTDGGVIAGTGLCNGNHIEGVYVLPGYQKRGCGTRIMDCLEREIGKNYDWSVLEASLPAACFYEHRGYRTTGHGVCELENGARLVYEKMEKKLETG